MSAVTEGFRGIPVFLGEDFDRLVYCERIDPRTGLLAAWDFSGYTSFWGQFTDDLASPTRTTSFIVQVAVDDDFGQVYTASDGYLRVYCDQAELEAWATDVHAVHPQALKVYGDIYGRDANGNDDRIGGGTMLLRYRVGAPPAA